MNKYLAIYQVMQMLAAQPQLIPNKGWIAMHRSKHSGNQFNRPYKWYY